MVLLRYLIYTAGHDLVPCFKMSFQNWDNNYIIGVSKAGLEFYKEFYIEKLKSELPVSKNSSMSSCYFRNTEMCNKVIPHPHPHPPFNNKGDYPFKQLPKKCLKGTIRQWRKDFQRQQ